MSDHSSRMIRATLSKNLALLVQPFASISEVCRQLDINRAQFNRYLTGESYPRPDTLKRICDFFGTDARILTEPLESFSNQEPMVLDHPMIDPFTPLNRTEISEASFPSGFYRLSRQSFLFPESHITALTYVMRRDGLTFVKGFEPVQSVLEQGLPRSLNAREYRGYVSQFEDGLGFVVSRRNGLTATFNFLTPVASFNNNFWSGYAVRTVPESLNTTRAARMVYEFLGRDLGAILSTARRSGLCTLDEVPPYHRRLLRAGEPFV